MKKKEIRYECELVDKAWGNKAEIKSVYGCADRQSLKAYLPLFQEHQVRSEYGRTY